MVQLDDQCFGRRRPWVRKRGRAIRRLDTHMIRWPTSFLELYFCVNATNKCEQAGCQSCVWRCQLHRGFTSQFNQLNWKSTVHGCTTSCSQLPALACLLLNIDRHLECHSSTIKLQWNGSGTGLSVSHTHVHGGTWSEVFGIGAVDGLGLRNQAAGIYRKIGCCLKGTMFWQITVVIGWMFCCLTAVLKQQIFVKHRW